MYIELAYVQSFDGFITRGDEPPHKWKSAADAKHFDQLRKSHNLFIFGSGTFDELKDFLKLDPRILRMVVTSRLKDYAKYIVPGQLEFSNLAPKELVAALEQRGYDRALLLSGQELSTSFFNEKLVDELVVTTETNKIFGHGKRIYTGTEALNLSPVSQETLDIKEKVILTRSKVIK